MLSFVTPVPSKDINYTTAPEATASPGTKTVSSSTMRRPPILPPLPRLLDVSSTVERHPSLQQGAPVVDNEAASDWLLPSPSQVGI